jgi:hypothetical protein
MAMYSPRQLYLLSFFARGWASWVKFWRECLELECGCGRLRLRRDSVVMGRFVSEV